MIMMTVMKTMMMMNMIMTTAIATLYNDGFHVNNNCGDNDNNYSTVNDKNTATTTITIVTASA